MKESSERVQYIAEYFASYKAKTESLNKLGLFDTATLFEIFAQKICEIWFGQQFKMSMKLELIFHMWIYCH